MTGFSKAEKDKLRYATDPEYRERKKSHSRRRYATKRDEVLAYQRVYGKAALLRLRARALEYLGGKCVRCGFAHPSALQFHHREPEEKSFDIGSGLRKWSSVRDELDKCDLLCANCHAIEHYSP